jgi:hypothetical protein
MIRQAQKQRLRETGHDEEATQNMTPEAAHELLGVLTVPKALKRTGRQTAPALRLSVGFNLGILRL